MAFLSVCDGRLTSGNGKGKKLTAKMVEFVDLYMIHMNATKAVELGSYTTKNPARHAADLMQHPLIRLEIEKRLSARSEKSTVEADYLIQKLFKIVNNDGIRTSDHLRAIELLGKSIALWKERQEISGVDGQAIQTEQRITESADAFTQKLKQLGKRNGTTGAAISDIRSVDNIIPFNQED